MALLDRLLGYESIGRIAINLRPDQDEFSVTSSIALPPGVWLAAYTEHLARTLYTLTAEGDEVAQALLEWCQTFAESAATSQPTDTQKVIERVVDEMRMRPAPPAAGGHLFTVDILRRADPFPLVQVRLPLMCALREIVSSNLAFLYHILREVHEPSFVRQTGTAIFGLLDYCARGGSFQEISCVRDSCAHVRKVTLGLTTAAIR